MGYIVLFVMASFATIANSSAFRDEINSTTNLETGSRQGWTSPPYKRGTMDILWGCGSTIILCCWSMLCLNVPSPLDTFWVQLRRKISIFVFMLIAPEVAAISAMGQYLNAHQSVKDFTVAEIGDWSLQHAFFAEMGGFVLQPRDWGSFPITAKQLLWLVQREYVTIPPTVLGRIKDRNKADATARTIMAIQATWFLANFFARLAQRLNITLLELTTVAYVYASLTTVFLWRHKPADVRVPEVLTTNASMAEILLAGGDDAREPYSNTPLDFVDRKEWFWSLYWQYTRRLLQYLKMLSTPPTRPIDRFSTFIAPNVPPWIFHCGALYYFGFAGILLAGWNINFPTQGEQVLWRVATAIHFACLVAGEVVTEIAFNIWPYLCERRSRRISANEAGDGHASQTSSSSYAVTPTLQNTTRPRPRTVWDWMRNNSEAQDPRARLPLKAALPCYFIGFFYIIVRMIILVEDFVELRSLPASCFDIPKWQQFVPHIGR
jgi:hypothetical protein